jgi:hypothetical protein
METWVDSGCAGFLANPCASSRVADPNAGFSKPKQPIPDFIRDGWLLI